MHQRDAASQRRVVLHFLQLVHQEHQLPVAGTGNELELGIASVIDDEARVAEPLFTAHAVEIGLPTLAVRRIGEHEVELARRKLVSRQCGLVRAADEVFRLIAFALEQQVGLADGVGFGVDLLPEQVN